MIQTHSRQVALNSTENWQSNGSLLWKLFDQNIIDFSYIKTQAYCTATIIKQDSKFGMKYL